MKVIFLDIDGVLNTMDTEKRNREEYLKTGIMKIEIDEFRIGYLKQIVDKTGALIVLSSSLRYRFKKEGDRLIAGGNRYAMEFIELFKKYGLSLYDVTPTIRDEFGNSGNRQEEIKLWLSYHDNIDGFVILDDETTFLMEFVGTNLIKLNTLKVGELLKDASSCTGINEEDIEKAIDILNNKALVKKYVRGKK